MKLFLLALFTWANAPYTMALLVVVFSVVFQIVGLLPSSGHDADMDADADADVDADAGGHADVDGDADADGDAGADHPDGDGGHDAEGEAHGGRGGAGGAHGVLGFLGFGKVPLSILWQTFFTMFGIAGVVVTSVASGRMGGLNAGVLVVSLPIALVSGLVLTRATANGIAKLVPSTSGKAASHKDLVGCKGVVISSRVTGEFGEVRLTDPAGRTIRLICRANEGEEEIGEGAEVVVTEWDRERDRIYVSSLAGLLKGK